MKKNAYIIYNHAGGYITYKRGELIITSMLVSYDNIIRLIDFDGITVDDLELKRG